MIRQIIFLFSLIILFVLGCDSLKGRKENSKRLTQGSDEGAKKETDLGSFSISSMGLGAIDNVVKVKIEINSMDESTADKRTVTEDFATDKVYSVTDLAVKVYKITIEFLDKYGKLVASGVAENISNQAGTITTLQLTTKSTGEKGKIEIKPVLVTPVNGGKDPVAEGALRYYAPACGFCVPSCQAGKEKVVDQKCEPGKSCSIEGQSCLWSVLDPEVGDGPSESHWVTCEKEHTTTDPQMCPVSKRAAKEQIHYLSAEESNAIAEKVLNLKVTTYRYKPEFGDPKEVQLGFIIDDVKSAPFILPNGERVNLYGYISAAVITLQQQQATIDSLKRKIDQLEAKK